MKKSREKQFSSLLSC